MVTWFRPDERKEGGGYTTTTVRLKKINGLECTLVFTDGTVISLADVAETEGDCFRGWI